MPPVLVAPYPRRQLILGQPGHCCALTETVLLIAAEWPVRLALVPLKRLVQTSDFLSMLLPAMENGSGAITGDHQVGAPVSPWTFSQLTALQSPDTRTHTSATQTDLVRC